MNDEQGLELSARLEIANSEGLRSLERNASKLKRLYPHWYEFGQEAHLFRRWTLGARERELILDQSKKGYELWPLLSNWESRHQVWDAAHVLRAWGEKRAMMGTQAQLLSLLREDGAKGLLLELKNLEPRTLPWLRDALTALQGSLRREGLGLALRLSARLCAGLGAMAQSFDAILLAAAPETEGNGRSLASPAFAKDSLERAALWGLGEPEIELPAGAFAVEKRMTHALTWQAWEEAVNQFGPAQREASSANLILKMPRGSFHAADAISLLSILFEARIHGLHRACLMDLGSEDPRIWESLEVFPKPFALSAKASFDR